MVKKLRYIASLLFLFIFLLPSVVKFEHHHRHIDLDLQNEKHYPVLHDNCPICNFEFSIFITTIENIDLQNENPLDRYFNNYCSQFNSNPSQFSFSLRGPPDKQI